MIVASTLAPATVGAPTFVEPSFSINNTLSKETLLPSSPCSLLTNNCCPFVTLNCCPAISTIAYISRYLLDTDSYSFFRTAKIHNFSIEQMFLSFFIINFQSLEVFYISKLQ